LLLGAGFSRNWGGWLATEAFEYLLGHPEVDEPIRQLLWKHRRGAGFEGALGELQEQRMRGGDAVVEGRLHILENALGQMFSDMDRGFANREFEFQNDVENSVHRFLGLFNVIFTLNQDLLLERHYLNNNVTLSDHPKGRWSGWEIVGMRKRPSRDTGFTIPGAENIGIWTPSGDLVIRERTQPYIKLHGSSNWRDEHDRRIWVMGSNKRAALGHNPLLTRLHELFRESLSSGATRLMIIGYSFSDEHINEIILSAAEHGQLQIFIVDPLGVGILDKNSTNAIYTEHELIQRLRPWIIGASRRPLSEIFGRDFVEHQKLMNFFPSNWQPRRRDWPRI